MRSAHRKTGVAALLVAAMVILPALPANADVVNGSRTCPAGRSLTTGTQTGSGTVYHHHNSYYKSFLNSGVTWRYWSKGLNSAFYILDATAGPLLNYNTACYT